MPDPLEDLFQSLNSLQKQNQTDIEQLRARLDFRRQKRKGVPEIILAEGKEPNDVLEIVDQFLNAIGRAIISRFTSELPPMIRERFYQFKIEEYLSAQMIIIKKKDFIQPQTGGKVGIITAGTSDIPVAEQARLIASEMGCTVYTSFDIGVAGMHRLFQPLKMMLDNEVDVIIVAAGMDGALPSVVAGLVDVPVIGLPTSTGYGMGGKGVAALLSMLQTCSPGLTVVNIDNAVGAAASAGLIANRAAKARLKQLQERSS